jgi:putative transposase
MARWAKPRWAGEKTGPNPTDRGKRGIKRSLLVDGRGTPLSVAVAGANINDHKLMRQTLETLATARPRPRPEAPQNLCLDKGYDYDEVRALAVEFAFTLPLRTRGEELRERVRHIGAKARRWVVERSFGWLSHWGGLLRDRAGRLDVSTGRLALAAILSGVEALINPMPIRDTAE